MPKRSNVFQDVVGMIQRQIAGTAAVEESGELENTRTRKKREVDILVRGKLGGHDVVVGIEAHDTSKSTRRATVEWVERMMGKHKNLGTDKLVLVSDIGLTKQALVLAREECIAVLTPRDLTNEDPVGLVVNSWRSIWQETREVVPHTMSVFVGDFTAEALLGLGPTGLVVFQDGAVLGTANDLAATLILDNRSRLPNLFDDLERAEPGSAECIIAAGPPLRVPRPGSESREPVYVRRTSALPLLPIHRVEIDCRTETRRLEIPLRHRRLGDTSFSQGAVEAYGENTIVVLTEPEKGKLRGSVRIRPVKQTATTPKSKRKGKTA